MCAAMGELLLQLGLVGIVAVAILALLLMVRRL